jgi:hypothetical protein
MRIHAIFFMLAFAGAAGADELEPAVKTSDAAVAPAAPTTVKPPAQVATKPAPPTAPAKTPAAARTRAMDEIDLGATQVTGNRELPNVMYVVPWKRPDLGEFAGRPPKSLLDELLAPVDRDVFRRQNRYFAALHPDVATPPAAAPATPVTKPASGSANALPPGDEK